MFQILKEYWVTLVIIIAESLYELIPDFFYTRSKHKDQFHKSFIRKQYDG